MVGFPGFEAPLPKPPLSQDAARTAKQKALIENGRHPLGGTLREPVGETCGSCRFSYQRSGGRHNYWKCEKVRATSGPGTDLRVSWPACHMWEGSDDVR